MKKRMRNQMKKWWCVAALSVVVLAAVAAGQQRNAADFEVQLKAASQKELREGDLKGAIAAYRKIEDNAGANRSAKAKALVEIGRLYDKLGTLDAQKTYERVLREFSNQSEAIAVAEARLKAIGAAPSTVAVAYTGLTQVASFRPQLQS